MRIRARWLRSRDAGCPGSRVPTLASRYPETRPARLFALTLLAVFGLECGVMALLAVLPPLDTWPEALVDSGLLSVFVFPVLYVTAFRPLLTLVKVLTATEQQLRTSQALLTDAQRLARFGHWEWQIATDRMAWSDEATRILGIDSSHTELGRAPLLESVHEEDRERFREVLEQVIQEGGKESIEHRVGSLDGSESMVHTQIEVVRGEHGDPVRVIGVVRDITEQWRAHRALEQAHAELDRRVRERTADLVAVNRELDMERRFSNAVVDTSGALIVVLDSAGRIVRFNRACETTTGYQAEEVKGHQVAALLLPAEDRNDAQEELSQLTAGGLPRRHQNHWLTRDGGRRFITWEDTAILDGQGSVDFVVCTGLDNTEQRKTEEALRESEQRIRTILETARDGFWLVGSNEKLLWVNDSYCELVGYDRSELIGCSVSVVEADEDPEILHRYLDPVQSRGHDRFETRHRRKDGSLVDLEVSVSYLPFAGGQIFAFLRDVTGRKRDAAELERRRAELEAIINSNSDAIVFTDTDRRIALTNPAFTTIFGYQAREVRGKTTHFLDVEKRQPEEASGDSTSEERDGRRERREVRCRRKDGSLLWVEVLPVPVRDARGTLLGHVGVYRDVSERHAAAETIRASLQEKEVLLKEIHHRVKNNLQVIASLLSLQSDQITDPNITTVLRESQNRIRSLALIHEKLYRSHDLARIDFREYVADLARSIVTSVSRLPMRIDLQIEVEDTAFGIDTAIPVALIINELVSNSISHAFPDRNHGQVRIELEHIGDGEVLVAVEDDGAGLPPDFDVHRSTTLGLQLVEVLSIQLGGGFDIVPAPGARFEVRFKPEPVLVKRESTMTSSSWSTRSRSRT